MTTQLKSHQLGALPQEGEKEANILHAVAHVANAHMNVEVVHKAGCCLWHSFCPHLSILRRCSALPTAGKSHSKGMLHLFC